MKLSELKVGMTPKQEIKKRFYEKHKSEILSRMRDWRKKNSAHLKAYSQEYKRTHPWHSTYVNIQKRCENPRSISYHLYGAKGVKNFLTYADLEFLWNRDGASALSVPSIDRIDPTTHYTLENCRFIERSENCRRARLGLRKQASEQK